VRVPPAGEYVADGAARQAAWVLSGAAAPPAWAAQGPPAAELHPSGPSAGAGIRERYAAARDLVLPHRR
jgi:xylulokinase